MRRAEPIAGLGGLLTIAGVLIAGVGVTGVLLILLGLLALAVPVTTLATSGPAKSIGTAVLASALGWISIVLALIRVLDDASTGNWVVLVGAVVAWVGSWLSMRDESTPGAVAPDIPRRPTPA
jgi:hypothetical protein